MKKSSSSKSRKFRFRRSISLNNPRNIHLLDTENKSSKFASNRISTGKYNICTFVPKFLFQQFRRYSNCFFLMITLLQQIPNVSPTGRYTTGAPLTFILTVSAIKEIFEDIRRHRADRGENRHRSLVLNKDTGKWETRFWRSVKVGDVVQVNNDSFFCADMVLLSSSEASSYSYIETANLDGETNLKTRKALGATQKLVTPEMLVKELSTAMITCEGPNKNLYAFEGTLKFNDQIYPIQSDQILLRGAKLKNTDWIIGAVIYTGHETKLIMNALRPARIKMSHIDYAVEIQTLHLFGILLFIAVFSTIGNRVWEERHLHQHWYLLTLVSGSGQSTRLDMIFFTFFILYTNLMPISLQVTLEVVRFIQAQFINSDLQMYCNEHNQPAMARTSNLNEELGAVRYILSDKTGTLTMNVMEFKQLSIAGSIFEVNQPESVLQFMQSNTENAAYAREFLTLLAVCHTVVPDKKADDKDSSDDLKYQAASPDECALVKGAARLGYRFTSRSADTVFINALDHEEQYEVLNVLEFTSDRKRMSVIVRCPDGKIRIYIKGADNVIYERLKERKMIDITVENVDTFSAQGLRTLCLGYAIIDENRYTSWKKSYDRAITNQSANREKLLEKVTNNIECDLILLGATAIEDKLQDGVPQAIATLLQASIKIWVLTGDKQETAINIGYSCNLIKQQNKLVVINEDSLDTTRKALREVQPNISSVVVIDGASLTYALSNDLRGDFCTIALAASAVICCRVSPNQKAEIVEMIKHKTKSVCLAIGDGANDVAMIRAASVGVGISGKEGLQAARSADYSISQFRFLTRLLLVHGSWSLHRVSKMIFYTFYKNAAFSIIELWFVMLSAWSGVTIFERWTLSLYNVLFTAFPPLSIGLFDRCASEDEIFRNPRLYRIANHNKFTTKLFWIWILTAVWHSLTMFWLTLFIVHHDTLWADGKSDGGWLIFGNFLYTYMVVVVCLKAGLELQYWNMFNLYSISLSILLWFIFVAVYSFFWPIFPISADMYGMCWLMFTSVSFWLGLIIVPLMTLLVDVMCVVLHI